MGRGLGQLQRRILDYLARLDGWSMSLELELELFGDDAARARAVSLRRAIAALRRRGQVRTGYDVGDGSYLNLFVWLADVPPPTGQVRRRRWRGQDDAIFHVFQRITHADVEAWLTTGRGVRGYPHDGPVWRQNPADTLVLVPYQLAVERIVAKLGGRDEKGRLMPSTSRAIRHALQRLSERKLIALHRATSGRRRYAMLEVSPNVLQTTNVVAS